MPNRKHLLLIGGLLIAAVAMFLSSIFPAASAPTVAHSSPDRPRFGMDHIFTPPTHNTTAPHELVRNTSATVNLSYLPPFTVKTNAKGLREDPFRRDTPFWVKRILVIGDDETFGVGVSREQRFTEKLEARLNQDSFYPTYHIVNAGIPSYSMQDFYHFLQEKGIQYSPDTVIVAFQIEDAITQAEKAQVHQTVQDAMNITGSDMEAVHSPRYNRLIGAQMRMLYSNITVPNSPLTRYGEKIVELGEREGFNTIFLVSKPIPSPERRLAVQEWENRTRATVLFPPDQYRQNPDDYSIPNGISPEGHTLIADMLFNHLKD